MPDESLAIAAIAAALGGDACRFDVDVLAECDLLERPTRRRAPIRESGEVTISLSSNQIATFLLERRLTP